jgi:diguanylate cyclase (GGDEF)-like protein
MWRRMALVIAAAALVGVLTASIFQMRDRAREHDEQLSARVDAAAHSFARELAERLDQADALARYLTATDSTASAVALRERMLNVDAFRGVSVLSFKEPAAADALMLSAAERRQLRTGGSVLQVTAADSGPCTIYLLHLINGGGAAGGGRAPTQIARLEIDTAGTWRGAEALARQESILVLDSAGHLLFEGADVSPQRLRLLDNPGAAAASDDGRDDGRADARADSTADSTADSRPVLRDWQQGGVSWRAASAKLAASSVRAGTDPWQVVVYARRAPLLPGALPPWDEFLLPLLLAAVAAALASGYLAARWQTVLVRVEAALQNLQQGRFQGVSLQGAADTPLALADGYNRAIGALESRWSAQQRLAEIDRLLLEATDLEQSLEPILRRVCELTSAPLAALALIDRDAPGHARSFMVGADGIVCPVSRVNLDADAMLGLQEMAHGILVQPHHLERFSFLQPLRSCGAEFCYVWPLLAGNELAALLSVGYRGSAQPTDELLSNGAQCTSRLQIALSNQDSDARLYRQAHFDSLTSLPNRLLFRDRLSQELSGNGDCGVGGALLYVDLDHFKRVNDSVGHIAGDQLLTVVAQRLRACVKDGDTVARLGGDEFSIILRQIDSAEAAHEVAQRIIDSLQRPVTIAGRDHQVRASIGITRFPEDGNTIEQLLRNADLAMYQAKDTGRSRAVSFNPAMARASAQLAESGLFRAVRRREFALYYQPQFALQSGELVALEALVRWQHPREGLRFPKDFVPAAEQSGLMVEIGTWVLESACRQLALWQEQGIAPSRLALNVSLAQLRSPEFPSLVSETLSRLGLPPRMLELEATEAVFADDEARQALRTVAALGVRVALDDFGSGYSSLNQLRQHPVDAIKIDGSFISEVPENYQATTLLATIIDMAHTLGQQVVAEGVETLPQLDYLRQRGCDVAQGFVLARPLNVADASERLAQRSGSTALLRRAAG